MDKVPRLPDEHLAKAKEIVSRHRRRSNCKSCYDRGYEGVNSLNMLVTCHKCVDVEAVMAEWRAYVRDTPALAATYGDYFEEEPDEGEGGAEARPAVTAVPESRPGRRPPRAAPRQHRSPGR